MPPGAIHLAADLGASSSRLMAASVHSGQLRLEEVSRFETPLIETPEGLFWDFETLWTSLLEALRQAAARYPAPALVSLGIDSWGVDYGYLDSTGGLAALPRSYRDPRTAELAPAVASRLGRHRLYDHTGIQFLPINTLYQCAADARDSPDLLARASRLLLIADLLHHRLTGRAVCERTNASTTQLYSPLTRDWCRDLAAEIGLPPALLPPLVDPGAVLGPLRVEVAAATGLPRLPVVAVATHDTASAVAAVPASASGFAYLSLGTWALLGAELSAPVLTEEALRLNFTNETGAGQTIRFLKNITGLWIVQECRRAWMETDGRPLPYAELAALAAAAPAFSAFIDPDAPAFSPRGDMPDTIRAFCRLTGQPAPQDRGTVLRIAFESLALKAGHVLAQLQRLTRPAPASLHVIGGGAQDPFLLQSLADTTGRTVLAGPVEATALGNVLLQMLATGALSSLEEGRALVRQSFPPAAVAPDPAAATAWQEAGGRFRSLLRSDEEIRP